MFRKILFFLPVCLLVIFGCQQKEPQGTAPSRPTVLVSVAPYAYFVRQIAGPDLMIHVLVPEDANPHVYEPKPKEVQALSKAQAWIRLGDPADLKAFNVFKERNPSMHIVDVTKGIKLLSTCEEGHGTHCHHEEGDLHIWLSPKLAKIQAMSIAEGLIQTFPEKSDEFNKGLAAFLTQLDALDSEITTLLKSKSGDAILVSHPAFAYFCRDYHLTQLSIEMEGKDPLPQHITELLAQAKAHKVTTVLLQPQYSNKGAELIAQELHISTATVNPYAEDYVDNLRAIAQIIASK